MTHNIYYQKHCLITGATGGIGRQIALKMAENHCQLFLTGTDTQKLQKLQMDLEFRFCDKIKTVSYPCDMDDINQVQELIDFAHQHLGHIDILINCAGNFIVKPLTFLSDDDFTSTFNINLRGPFMLCRAFASDMIKNQWGRIVNIGSSSSYLGTRNSSLYCAAKHGLLGFSRALHDELKEYNIRTFCISPGGTKTSMGHQIENQNFETFLDPEEIAETVSFICSFDGPMITEEIRLNRFKT